MKQNNKKRARWGEAVVDVILEILFTAIMFFVGWGALSLFGIDLDNIDPDIAVLIGIAFIAVLAVCIFFIIRFMKKRKKDNSTD